MFQPLHSNQADSLLLSQTIGRIACTNGDKPYIFPVSYCYDGNYIYGQTNVGTKLDILRTHPHVSFEVDSALDMNNWQSVIIEGVFEELSDSDIESARAILYNRIFQIMTESRVHAHEHGVSSEIDDSNRIKDILFRIKINEISGRMFSPGNP